MRFICLTIRAVASCSSESLFGAYPPPGILPIWVWATVLGLQRTQHKSSPEVLGQLWNRLMVDTGGQ